MFIAKPAMLCVGKTRHERGRAEASDRECPEQVSAKQQERQDDVSNKLPQISAMIIMLLSCVCCRVCAFVFSFVFVCC